MTVLVCFVVEVDIYQVPVKTINEVLKKIPSSPAALDSMSVRS